MKAGLNYEILTAWLARALIFIIATVGWQVLGRIRSIELNQVKIMTHLGINSVATQQDAPGFFDVAMSDKTDNSAAFP